MEWVLEVEGVCLMKKFFIGGTIQPTKSLYGPVATNGPFIKGTRQPTRWKIEEIDSVLYCVWYSL